MGRRIYVDTNVWISLFKEEIDSHGRPLTHWSREFFERIAADDGTIILSVLVAVRQKYPYLLQIMREFIEAAKFKCERAVIEEEDLEMAAGTERRIKRALGFSIGIKDATHFIIARKTNADLFVSWERKHKEVGELLRITVVEPSEY